MATSKFDLLAGYLKIFSPGSENCNSAKRVEKNDIIWYFSSRTENFHLLACFKEQFPSSKLQNNFPASLK